MEEEFIAPENGTHSEHPTNGNDLITNGHQDEEEDLDHAHFQGGFIDDCDENLQGALHNGEEQEEMHNNALVQDVLEEQDEVEEHDEVLQQDSLQKDEGEEQDQVLLQSVLKEDDVQGACEALLQRNESEQPHEQSKQQQVEESEEVDEDEDSDDSEESEEDLILENRLRHRKVNCAGEVMRQERQILRQITKILKKDKAALSAEEKDILKAHPKLHDKVVKRFSKKQKDEERKQEIEDSTPVLLRKCVQLARAIHEARNLVVYTGAGISTAANIPDYRGPSGVWTLMDKGKEVAQCNLEEATPTFTHMALFTLYKLGKLKHVVSQNCDGLHLRSGLPRSALSEIHGNMFIEICKHCKPMRPFVRLFDVTQRTNKNRHSTHRRCYVCGNSLFDTIVHFGERGCLKWPINWKGATKAAQKADVILCLGSSLKVLRRYSWLWCMDRPPKQRPKLYIVNLQWTPKDSSAKIKLNGRCDYVMKQIMTYLDMNVPDYCMSNDPLLTYATSLSPYEMHTSGRNDIITKPSDNDESTDSGDTKTDNGFAAFSPDHDYANPPRPRRSKPLAKGKDSLGNIDYKTMPWPRDALYLSYEPSFEYIDEDASIGEDAFCCDCCDPAKRRKRTETSSEDEEEDEDEEEEDDTDSLDSKTSSLKNSNGLKIELKDEPTETKTEMKPEEEEESSSSKSSTPTTLSNQPGWFGKGRRKRSRVS